MKILDICHRVPYPPETGRNIRQFHFIKYLSKIHELHLVYPSFSQDDITQGKKLKKYCKSISTCLIKHSMLKAYASVPLLRPSSFNYFYSKELQKIIDNIECDLILIRSSQMAMYVINRPEKKIADIGDSDAEKWKDYSKEKFFPFGPVYFLEYLKVKRWEKKIINKFDKTIVISETEKKLVHNQAIVISNGADFPKIKKLKKIPNTIIFSGAMDYKPNIDAVIFFHDKVFPEIKKKFPEVQFIVAGMNPPKKIQKLKNLKTTGYIKDMNSFIAKHTIYIAPLVVSRGVLNKILNAMAIGIPVVATKIANQGISAKNGKEILLADSAEEFAQQIIRVLQNKNLQKKLSSNARKFVKKNFNWKNEYKELDQVIELIK